jgi:hypothetical protein
MQQLCEPLCLDWYMNTLGVHLPYANRTKDAVSQRSMRIITPLL